MQKTHGKKLPPGPKGSFLLGDFLNFRKHDDLLSYATMLAREYGDIAHVKMGPYHLIFLSNPKDLKRILTNKENKYDKKKASNIELIGGNAINTLLTGKEWKEKLDLFSKNISRIDPVDHEVILNAILKKLFIKWDKAIQTKAVSNISMDMLEITLSSIAKLMLDVDPDFLNVPEINFHKYRVVTNAIKRSLRLINPPIFLQFDLFESLKYRNHMTDTILKNFLQHSSHDSYLGDLVSKYNITQVDSSHIKEITGEMYSAFYLGSDPADKLLSWSFYYLSMYPEERVKVANEINQVTQGKEISLSQVKDLHYCGMFLNEVLRLRTPYAVIARNTLIEDEIKGYLIPKNSVCVALTLLAHKHLDYWENPEAFFPDRFRSIDLKNNEQYFPFSLGIHECPGQSFVFKQSLFVLARFLQKYKFSLLPNVDYSVKFLGVLSCKNNIQGHLSKIDG